jgi:hypothetical protein
MAVRGRSFKQGQVTEAEVREALGLFEVDYKVKNTRAGLAELADYESDILVVDGDLRVGGDLDLKNEGIYVLVVRGDLVVDGVYRDYDDPESYLLVTGTMKARDVITAGWLEVHGDLEVTGRLVGDYNDCAAYIRGNVRAGLFYGEEHHFTIKGALEAGVVIGRPRLEITHKPAAIGLDDPRLLEHVDRDLLRTYDDEDDAGTPIVGIDGIADFRAFKKRVAAGLPLRTP